MGGTKWGATRGVKKGGVKQKRSAGGMEKSGESRQGQTWLNGDAEGKKRRLKVGEKSVRGGARSGIKAGRQQGVRDKGRSAGEGGSHSCVGRRPRRVCGRWGSAAGPDPPT